ncbi:MAG: hypothetical protein U1E77_11595 [Inhella sp.]
MIAENVPVLLVGSTRAGDIVRDADILHLYRRAGAEVRFLLGIESYSEATARAPADRQGRQHERRPSGDSAAAPARHPLDGDLRRRLRGRRDTDLWRSLRHLLRYDPDQIQLLYGRPHRWTPFYKTAEHRAVIQPDTRRWDYS